MPWSQSTKILQQQNDEEIQTPDGQQILVGASEDEVLVTVEGFNNWENRSPREVIDYQRSLEQGFDTWEGTDYVGLELEGRIIKEDEEWTASIESDNNEQLLIWWTNQNWRMRTKIEA